MKLRSTHSLLIASLVVAQSALSELQAGPIIYVDNTATGANDGSSWEDAYNDLQDALADAAEPGGAGAQIWVAAGTYTPAPPGGDRTITFQLVSGVGLYGGFAGWETSLDERDWETNVTVLSGDLNGDDGPDFENNGENSYHVVMASGCDETTVLDGFTIMGGNADAMETDGCGGGMYNDDGNPTLANCTFSGNQAGAGGGMANTESSNPMLTNCTFTGNSGGGWGGGMFNDHSSPTLTNCAFDDNSAMRGGGLYNYIDCNLMLTNCTFTGNTATSSSVGFGGGMYNYENSNPTLIGCTFTGNSAIGLGNTGTGGGMANVLGSSPVLTDCTFVANSHLEARDKVVGCITTKAAIQHSPSPFAENTSEDWAGGIYNYQSSSPTLTNCTFTGNVAYTYGGGMYNSHDSSPTIINCAFRDNLVLSLVGHGGGMSNFQNSNPTLVKCTFSGNSTSDVGGGMHNYDSNPRLTNCVFTGNTARGDPSCHPSGGGMYNANSSPVVTGCTFTGNAAQQDGGGMYNGGGSSPSVSNCILWGNAAPEGSQIYDDLGSDPSVIYSCVQGGYGDPEDNNIDADPLFVDPGYWDDNGTPADPSDDFWVDGDYHLQAGSPCINTGDPDFVAEPGETDLDGHARVLCEFVDMGAYEFGIGDYDCDQDVDLADFANWDGCTTGPEGGPYPAGCEAFDFEYDGDVDLVDFAGFQAVFVWSTP